MANETVLNIMGNLTADPQLRHTGSNRSVANFTIASTPSRFNKDTRQWEDSDPLFIRCTAWGDLAEHVAGSLHKGTRVIAQGRLFQQQYTDKNGVKRNPIQMTVDDIGPSLRYSTASVDRVQRSASRTPSNSRSNGAWRRGQAYSSNSHSNYASSRDYSNGAGFGGGSAQPNGTAEEPGF